MTETAALDRFGARRMPDAESPASGPGITGEETVDVGGVGSLPDRRGESIALRADGCDLPAAARLDTASERGLFRRGGTLPFVLRQLAGAPAASA